METGKLLIIVGIIIVLIGAVLQFAPWVFSWFGRLPGDIRIEKENGLFFFPLTSMLIVSVLLSLLANWFFRR